jgi:hypothetical protein
MLNNFTYFIIKIILFRNLCTMDNLDSTILKNLALEWWMVSLKWIMWSSKVLDPSSKAKKNKAPTLEDVLAKLSMYLPPAPCKDAQYFHWVCGLSKDKQNPHALSEHWNAPRSVLQAIFGLANTRHSHSMKNVKDKAIWNHLHKIWPLLLIQGTSKNRPTTKEFCFGIYY